MSSNEYIKKHVDEIMNDPSFEPPLNTAMACAWICGNLKGVNLKVLNLTKLSSLADYFVFASATNSTQASAIADQISKQLKKRGISIKSREGDKETDWILIDAGDVIVHIFLESSRQSYDLDSLWVKAPRVEIPNSYYFSDPNEEDSASASSKDDLDYF